MFKMAGNLPISSILNHHRLLLDAASTTSTSPDTSTFDATMVIILAALLCALVCALGLNSIIRCIIRCTRRLALMEPADEEAVARFAAARGMKNRGGCSIRSMIPVAVYGVDGVKVVGGADCSICLGEFVDGEKIRVLPRCSHGFHVRCIDAWLVSHSSCPTCRRSLAEDGRGAQPPDEAGGGRREVEERINVDE